MAFVGRPPHAQKLPRTRGCVARTPRTIAVPPPVALWQT